MNIQAYRKKFIIIAMSAMTACLVLLLLLINLFNFYGAIAEQKEILSILSENGGIFPSFNPHMHRKQAPFLPYQITEETEYRIRHFTVTMDGKDMNVNLKWIAAVDEAEAKTYAQRATEMNREYGFIDNYIFKIHPRGEGNRTQIIFLDWQEKLNAIRNFAFISIFMGIVALAATFLIVVALSKRAIRPAVISAQRQQQFITDASHELKTPLSAISVNMEVLAMEVGASEWIESTKEQIKLLQELVNQLISTVRFEEEASIYTEKQLVDMSELVLDAASYFMSRAEAAGRNIEVDAPEHTMMSGNEELLRRMISVLCDNAIKHASGEGNIRLSLSQKGKTVTLRVQNPWPVSKDASVYERMFDRFYKADTSRNKNDARGGFGIGLSIAEKAAQWHGGTIQAVPVGNDQICFIVTLMSDK